MVQLSVSTSVSVKDGPTMTTGTDVPADSYVVATVELAAAGEAGDGDDVPLFPPAGDVALLAVTAVTATGAAASIEIVPTGTGNAGEPLTVAGGLFVANASVLAGLADGGPRTLAVTNKEAADVVVTVLAVLDTP